MSLAEIHKKAKLVMIPSGFKSSSSTDNLYSVIPSNGDGDFNYAGTTNGTRVNKDGLIEIASSNQPRLDYNPSNPQNPHLLLEPESTNLVTYSEDYSQSEWTNSTFTKDATITNNSQSVAPDGTSGVFQYECTVSGSNSQLGALKSITSGVAYTSSFYIKRINGVGSVKIRDINNTELDITDNLTSDWKRYTITGTSNSTNGRVYVNVLNAGDIIEVWGVQLEQQSFATSYIPTSGSATTRTVDTCNSAGNSSIINTSEGVLFAEIAALANDSSLRDISVSNGSTDRILLSYLNSSNRIAMQFIDGGISQFTLQFDGATITNFNKIAIKYKSSDYALWVNGSERATNTSHTNALAGLDRINFDRGDGGDDFFGKCKQLMYFDTILTDAELTTLTT
jgi:hypothetical protein